MPIAPRDGAAPVSNLPADQIIALAGFIGPALLLNFAFFGGRLFGLGR